jgi:hypothetical protein
MSKRKKKKVVKRPHNWHKDYLTSLAVKLHEMNPSVPIILNVLKDVGQLFYTGGYMRRQEDNILFRAKQNKHFEDDFKKECDFIDDLIHEKANQISK